MCFTLQCEVIILHAIPIWFPEPFLTHHVYVFSENWSAKPEDTWSDYIKDRFRNHFLAV